MTLQKFPLTEGEADFHVEGAGKPCKTNFHNGGMLDFAPSSSSTAVPVSHNYLLPIRHLALHGIPVIFYDQLGCGLSTHLPHLSNTTREKFWTVDLFKSELSNLVKHLNLESYDVLGNSWGGMLGASTPSPNPRDSTNSSSRILLLLPKNVEEHSKSTKKAEQPTPPTLAKDNTVYLSMNGPSEFFVIGTLKSWNIIHEIHKIKVPTLLLNGKYDEAQDEVMEPFFKNIEKVKWFRFAESSHMPQVE
ncbi:uncharacterized protein PAC_09971 [Phialocephala subalpina]|uniref:AB hydrolase-1 domain-containing protein n=1 Tax=Phialocephala subalpina TaxID=576137 RepID=A0A1L7X4Y6_9HELO|nr:uncharacterized protein PAC_09971 [Phialocephala subalpina]